ncbi:N-terminal acetyltransferase [Orbilia ellipsospora]|uniref:N-terminal acetyltransferase n=1 Tax=Orbilia ellipsospora TaxID=2528407 RepID=A0AAV9XNS2_9PEZI
MTTEEIPNPHLPVTLSEEQTEEYLAFLKFTKDEIIEIKEPTLENLAILMLRHLSEAPFNNVDIHYTKAHKITINLDHLFNKIVNRKRGGYCMEMNLLFSHLLATLGYNVWMAPARVSRERGGDVNNRNFHGISHLINLVGFQDGRVFLVDVAYGGSNIVQPVQLVEGNVVDGVGEEKYRLLKIPLPEMRRKELHWLLQQRATPETPWIDLYMFLEVEVAIMDCEVWSYWASTKEDIFVDNILCARVIREGNKVVGRYTMFNGQIKKRLNFEVEDLPELGSEEERVKALRDYWGIELSEEDQAAIRGQAPEIRSS